jgi:tight adherence protein B
MAAGLAAGLILLVTAAGAGAQAQRGLSIRDVELEDFPTVAVTVGVSATEDLSAADFRVTENGTAVQGLEAEPVDVASANVDVVLVLDNSNSMIGSRQEAAVAAARAFLETVPPQVRIGLVTFNAVPEIRAPLQTGRSAALSALDTLDNAAGTALFDAVEVAAGMFTRRGSHAIVVLSDGGDISSRGSLDSAVAAAKAREVAVYSVGLESDEGGAATLTTLSNRTGGRFSPTVTDEVLNVYQGLAAEVSNQYRLEFRSAVAGETSLTITVATGELSDRAVVLTPALAASAPPSPEAATAGPLPPGVMFGIAVGLSFLAALALVISVAGGVLGARRDRVLARRMSAPPVGTMPAAPGTADRGAGAWIPGSLASVGDRLAGTGGFRSSLDHALERAGVAIRPGEFLAGSALAFLITGLLVGVLLGNIVLAILLAMIAGLVPTVLLLRASRKRMEAFQEQLPDILMVLASSLRAGHSFLQALDLVAKEIPDPGGSELGRVVAEISLGRPIEDTLLSWAARMNSDNLNWAVMAVNIQREVGGNLAELLETVAETVRERETIRRQIRALTADGRLSMIILVSLPFVIGLYLSQVNPTYLNLLFSRFVGQAMLVGGGLLMAVGIFWMRKIVDIDV